jgi:hypothetical protein
MPAFGVVDGVQQGTVECAHTAPYYFFGKDDTFAIDCAIPFGLNSRQMTAWMYEGNGMKLLREFYAGYNIVNFPMGNTGAQMGGWYRKEIKSLADIKGLKMRIGGFGGKVLSAIGGVPQNIPAAKSTRRWKRAPSMPPSGSAPMTTRSSASSRSPSTTTTPAGGKVVRSSRSTSIRRPTTRCRPTTRPSLLPPHPMPTSSCRPSTTPRTRRP